MGPLLDGAARINNEELYLRLENENLYDYVDID
jgi:hypothetical protein